jgi:hypothetical protein
MYAGHMRLACLITALPGMLFADDRCLPCHSQEAHSYASTGMGRSITRPRPEAMSDQRFEHHPSGSQFRAVWREGRLFHELTRNGVRSLYEPSWAIGSGNQGKSYLVVIGDALFQSPISWYSMRRAWDLSPGFEGDEQPDFFRPVTSDCLFCHAGTVRPRTGTLNRYLDPPFEPATIGCERCHGDPTTHLSTPRKGNIVNPSRLEPDRRDAVCEQCHLSGEARIPNPGKAFSDFLPGMRMEDIFSVYVEESAVDPQGLKVVSHSEQMARSRCYLESRSKMWCGTCHNPHKQVADEGSRGRQECMACHQNQEIAAHRAKLGGDCAGCHMPRMQSYDGGHTAFHDHWIRLNPQPPSGTSDGRLRAWREPEGALRERNLGLAYISVSSKSGDMSQLHQGFSLLERKAGDGAVETARGFALLRLQRTREAVEAFRRAVNETPNDSTRQLNLAAALLAADDRVEAKRRAEEAIALEPLLEDAYALLAEIEPKRASYWKERYGKLVPQRVLR